MNHEGFSGYIVEVCTYEKTGEFFGIGNYVNYHYDWVHVGWGNAGLASLEKTLIEWARSIGREYEHVKTLHTASGVYYGNCKSEGSFWDVKVEFNKRGNTKIVLAFAKSQEDIPTVFINEGISKIVSVQKSQIKYHTDF